MAQMKEAVVMGRLGLLVPVVEDDHAARVDGVTPGPREGGRDRDQVLALEDAVVHKLDRVLVMVPPSVRRVHLAVERERPRRVVERPKARQRRRVVRRDDRVLLGRVVVRVDGHDLAALHPLVLELIDDALATLLPIGVAVLHILELANLRAKLGALLLLRQRRHLWSGNSLDFRLHLLGGEGDVVSRVEERVPDHWVGNARADAEPEGLRLGLVPLLLGEPLLLARRSQPLCFVRVPEIFVVADVARDVLEVTLGRE